MRKYTSIILVLAVFSASGCRTLVRNADEILEQSGKVAKNADEIVGKSGKVAKNIESERAARATINLIQSLGSKGRAVVDAGQTAGIGYAIDQRNSGNLISQSTMQEVVYQTLLEEAEKTALQIARKQLKELALGITIETLASFNSDEVEE